MECKQIVIILGKYLNNELDEISKKDVSQHINNCHECKMELQNTRAVYNILEFKTDVNIPTNFTLSVMEQIRVIKVKSETIPSYRVWGMSLIAAAIALLIVNTSGFKIEPDYKVILEKTNTVQKSITLTVDQTSQSILKVFNNINER